MLTCENATHNSPLVVEQIEKVEHVPAQTSLRYELGEVVHGTDVSVVDAASTCVSVVSSQWSVVSGQWSVVIGQ